MSSPEQPQTDEFLQDGGFGHDSAPRRGMGERRSTDLYEEVLKVVDRVVLVALPELC